MQRIGLGQPHMAIDARALVKPSVAKAGVDARDNIVLRAIGQKVRQIETERRIAVVVATDEAAIDKDNHIAKRAVELNRNPLARVARRNLELAPVPTDAGLRITPSKRLESVRILLFIVNERQLHRPIVGQVEGAPLRVVELGLGEIEVARLGKISLPISETEVLRRIAAIAKLKLPTEVKQQFLSRRNR